MLRFRGPDYDDKEYDSCGNTTIAVLEIDSITIPLCRECLTSLKRDIKEYNQKHYCGRCINFRGSSSGSVHYGGSCVADKEIDPKNYGYENSVDYFKECNNSKFCIDENKEL